MPTPFLYYKAVIYKDAVHRPLGTNERLSTDSIPISVANGNQIKTFDDGIYIGSAVGGRTLFYLDPVNGVDAPDRGDKATPMKTINYLISYINTQSGGRFMGNITIAMKCGTSDTYSVGFNLGGSIRITFWGDPKYGDFDSPGIVDGTVATYMPQD